MSDSTSVSPLLTSPGSELELPAAGSDGLRVGGSLRGYVRRVAQLTDQEREQMFVLLARYFANVSWEQFTQDLDEKEWAIVLTDPSSCRLRGFSTLMRIETEIDNQPVVGFFSGDTIVDKRYWTETALPRLWAQHVFRLAAAIRHARVYWFLICSGYKTYRYLPVFFREFYPTYERPTPPAVKSVLDRLASLKFPTGYDADRGIVRLSRPAVLLPGVAEITERRLQDPHVAFFAAANPGHCSGEELACLTEVIPSNLTPAGRRMLGLRDRKGH